MARRGRVVAQPVDPINPIGLNVLRRPGSKLEDAEISPKAPASGCPAAVVNAPDPVGYAARS